MSLQKVRRVAGERERDIYIYIYMFGSCCRIAVFFCVSDVRRIARISFAFISLLVDATKFKGGLNAAQLEMVGESFGRKS